MGRSFLRGTGMPTSARRLRRKGRWRRQSGRGGGGRGAGVSAIRRVLTRGDWMLQNSGNIEHGVAEMKSGPVNSSPLGCAAARGRPPDRDWIPPGEGGDSSPLWTGRRGCPAVRCQKVFHAPTSTDILRPVGASPSETPTQSSRCSSRPRAWLGDPLGVGVTSTTLALNSHDPLLFPWGGGVLRLPDPSRRIPLASAAPTCLTAEESISASACPLP
jgi:hypothetical protein